MKCAAFQLCAEQILCGGLCPRWYWWMHTLKINIVLARNSRWGFSSRESPTRSPKLDALFLGFFIAFIDGAGWSPSRQIPTETLEQTHVQYQSQLIARCWRLSRFRLLNISTCNERSYVAVWHAVWSARHFTILYFQAEEIREWLAADFQLPTHGPFLSWKKLQATRERR